MEQSNSYKAMKYLSIPTIFISNLAIYIILGVWLDKKFDIGNYMILIILFGLFMACYSTYKVLLKMSNE
ncbi:MAG: AtpZ/AtpI family protein [Bacilli bacterium]